MFEDIMKFETGWPARVAAGVDKIVTRMTFGEPWEFRGIDPSLASKAHVDVGESQFRTVFHPRFGGKYVPTHMPTGAFEDLPGKSIVHVYDGEQLIERKRLKDKPQGFVVYEHGSDESIEAFLNSLEADKKRPRK